MVFTINKEYKILNFSSFYHNFTIFFRITMSSSCLLCSNIQYHLHDHKQTSVRILIESDKNCFKVWFVEGHFTTIISMHQKFKKSKKDVVRHTLKFYYIVHPIEENSTHMHGQNKCTPYNVSFYVYFFCSLFIAKQNGAIRNKSI